MAVHKPDMPTEPKPAEPKATPAKPERKPWKKKTPVEVVQDHLDGSLLLPRFAFRLSRGRFRFSRLRFGRHIGLMDCHRFPPYSVAAVAGSPTVRACGSLRAWPEARCG